MYADLVLEDFAEFAAGRACTTVDDALYEWLFEGRGTELCASSRQVYLSAVVAIVRAIAMGRSFPSACGELHLGDARSWEALDPDCFSAAIFVHTKRSNA